MEIHTPNDMKQVQAVLDLHYRNYSRKQLQVLRGVDSVRHLTTVGAVVGEGGFCLIAGSSGNVDGYIIVLEHVRAAGTWFEISDLYVRPEVRRKSLGKTLVDASTIRCAERGGAGIYLEVGLKKAWLHGMYESCGFQSVSTTMQLLLAAQPVKDAA